MRKIGLGCSVLAAVLAAACGGSGPGRLVRLEVAPPVVEVTEHLEAAVTVTAVIDDGTRRDVTGEAVLAVADGAVAAVSGPGVRGVAPGGTTLQASWGGLQASARVAVLPAVLVSLRITTADAAVAAGLATRAVALGTFSDGTERDVTALVTWHAVPADEACASHEAEEAREPLEVDAEGHLDARYECAVTLTASLSGLSAGAPLQVTAAAPAGLTLTLSRGSAPLGTHVAVLVQAAMSDGSVRDVTAEASVRADDEEVAEWHDDDLTIEAQGPGATVVRVGWRGFTASAAFEVTASAIAEIVVLPPDDEVHPGRLLTFTALGFWSNGDVTYVTGAVAWTSSDEGVAVPYASMGAGKVLARAPGKAWVIATDPATGVSGRFELAVPAL